MNFQRNDFFGYYLSNPVLKAFLFSIFIFISVILLCWPKIIASVDWFKDGRVYASGISLAHLSVSINSKFCNQQHMNDPQLFAYFQSGKVNEQTRLLDLPHCSKNMTAWESEGLPLYWLNKTIIYFFGNISLHQMAILYRLIQILPLCVFTFYLLSISVSALTAWLMTLVAVSLTLHLDLPMEPYGFVLPCLLLILSCYGFSIRYQSYQNFLKHTAVLVCVTAVEFFLFYMRSSNLPEILAIIAVYLLYLLTQSPQRAVQYKAIATALLVPFFCLLGLQQMLTLSSHLNVKYLTHPVMHPVVLGLAIPGNAFTEKQGLEWDDSVGFNLVKGMDSTPGATDSYSMLYEKDLSQYYFSLWKQYPKEMLSLYFLKMKHLYATIVHENFFLHPFSLIPAVLFYMTLFAAVCFLFYKFWTRFENIAYLQLVLSLTTLLGFAENILIFSRYRLQYQSFIIFYLFVLIFLFYKNILLVVFYIFRKLIQKLTMRNSIRGQV